MIKGLFCHYLPIYKDINGNYCSTTLTNDFFSRYLCVVNQLFVATRVYNINNTFEEAHQEKISLDRVNIIEFPNLSTIKGFLLDLPKAKKKINHIAKSMDLIFIRGGIIGLLGVDAAKKANKPYLIECAGCSWDEYWNYSLIGKLIAPYMEYREKKDVLNASYVIYVTEKWLQTRYPTHGISTYASNVILETIDENALKKRLEKIENFDDNKTIKVGTIGGIDNKAKGQHFVIEAISKLRKKYDMQYELVGGGDNSFLKKIAEKFNVEKNIKFKEQLTHNEILKWLDDIDLYIQPSMQEGLPRSLIEAMSRACPAIGSTTGGIPELLDKEYIFKRGSVEDLVKVMRYALTHSLEQPAKNNFEKSKEYHIDVLNTRRTEIYTHYLNEIRNKNSM